MTNVTLREIASFGLESEVDSFICARARGVPYASDLEHADDCKILARQRELRGKSLSFLGIFKSPPIVYKFERNRVGKILRPVENFRQVSDELVAHFASKRVVADGQSWLNRMVVVCLHLGGQVSSLVVLAIEKYGSKVCLKEWGCDRGSRANGTGIEIQGGC